MKRKRYYDYTTDTYFETSEAYIEYALYRINSAMQSGKYVHTADALADLYKMLGIHTPDAWYGLYDAVELEGELNINDLPFKEVKDPETEEDKEE